MDDYITLYTKHSQNATGLCPYRVGGNVECDSLTKCERCGWFPDTEERRIRDLHRRLKIPYKADGEGLIRIRKRWH